VDLGRDGILRASSFVRYPLLLLLLGAFQGRRLAGVLESGLEDTHLFVSCTEIRVTTAQSMKSSYEYPSCL